MAEPIATDTPDYQRGVFNPQALLATVPANTASVTVGIPTNAETLIVVAADISDGGVIYAQGTGTLYKYSGVRINAQAHMTAATTWFFDVSAAMDEQVKIVFANAPGQIWFVYADAAAHLVADSSANKNTVGQAYVIGSVPSTFSNDHPPTEIQTNSALVAASGNIVAPAGAGNRYRLYAVTMASTAAGVVGVVNSGNATIAYCCCAGVGNNTVVFPDQGVPLPTNTPIYYQQLFGANDMVITVAYSLENV